MPAPVEPPELARVLDYAERSRAGDWSLRSALCRYASPQPRRVREVLEHVRRIDAALREHLKGIERDGPTVWAAVGAPGEPDDQPLVIGLLRAMVELDRLGDVLAAWTVDRHGERPDGTVDAVVADVERRLEALQVPREERIRPGPQRG